MDKKNNKASSIDDYYEGRIFPPAWLAIVIVLSVLLVFSVSVAGCVILLRCM